jgi:hypothetical protein
MIDAAVAAIKEGLRGNGNHSDLELLYDLWDFSRFWVFFYALSWILSSLILFMKVIEKLTVILSALGTFVRTLIRTTSLV